MTIKLMGKDIFFVTESSLHEFAWISESNLFPAETKSVPQKTEDGSGPQKDASKDSIQGIIEGIQRLGGSWNVEKQRNYARAEAQALTVMFKCLDDDDQALYDEHRNAFGFWNALKAKYKKPQTVVSSFYTNKIAIFTYREDAGLGANWARLLRYRRKVISANPRMNHAYPDDVLFDILTDNLPDLYKSTVFSLRTQLMYTVDQKMQFLYQVESKTSTLYGIDSEEEESARIAKDRNRGRWDRASSHPARDCSESDQSIRDSRHRKCYLCKMKHFVRDCPDLELAVRAVEKHHENRR
ncbi:hypothetical protein K3495_g16244, partial [Podosphaera aphanis]